MQKTISLYYCTTVEPVNLNSGKSGHLKLQTTDIKLWSQIFSQYNTANYTQLYIHT